VACHKAFQDFRFLTVYPEIRTSWAMQDAQLGQFDPRLEVCPRNQRLKALEQPQLDTDLVAREFLRLANEKNLPGRFRLNSRRLQHLGHSEYSTAPPDSQSAPDVYKHGLSKIRLEGAHSLRRFRATRLDLVRLSRPTFVYCESGMEKTAPEDSGRSEP